MSLSDIIQLPKVDVSTKKGIIFDLDGTIADSMQHWCSPTLWKRKTEAERVAGMKRFYASEIEPKPYTLQLLQKLKNGNVPICILSATPADASKPFIEKYGIDKLVLFYMDCEEWGGEKSTPEPYYAAAEKMGLAKDEVIVFEDYPQSAHCASKGGLCVVGVYDDLSKDSMFEMRHYCSDYIYNFSKILL